MKYKKFIIKNYRGIVGPLTIDIERDHLIPIVGVNESGKTTILHAILAFDHYNDKQNDGMHIKDAQNLYKSSPLPPIITAEIELAWDDLIDLLKDAMADVRKNPAHEHILATIVSAQRAYSRKRKQFPGSFTIHRNLADLKYSIDSPLFDNIDLNEVLAKQILSNLPYILYFDDFRGSVEDKIEILDTEKSDWLSILQQLFVKTDSQYSVHDLPKMEERRRKGVIAKVQKYLNDTLTRQWQDFQLEDINALNISIDYLDQEVNGTKRSFLKLDVVETDINNDQHFFFIRNRSKGFFWFFNFVMKLEFNPKLAGTATYNAIYLLDEPGSYLHASAQQKLCRKLRDLSRDNRVLYCTHSHYLLDPEVIPVNRVYIADKDDSGATTLCPIPEYTGSVLQKRGAFQPIWDALQIKPFSLELGNERVVIVEGICDYYAFECFKGDRKIRVMPSVGAPSIQYFISLMIAWHIDYCAVWDNDDEGIKCMNVATKHFGAIESSKRFRLLPKLARMKKTVLEHLFDSQDVQHIKNVLSLPNNCSFDKSLMTLFYSINKGEIVRSLGGKTKDRFDEVFNILEPKPGLL